MLKVTNLAGLGGKQVYSANAVLLDGTNDYLSRGADLTGNADGKLGIVSIWINFKGGNATRQIIASANNGFWLIEKTAANLIRVVGFTSGSTKTLELFSTTAYTDASGWLHLLAFWDLANTTAGLFINDADDENTGVSVALNNDIDYTRTEHHIGSNTVGAGNKLNADVADCYINFGEYIDGSVENDRRKFIDAAGKPVFLGGDGALPTGTAPIQFFTGATATWHTNAGTGGGFTENGALADGSDSPSE